MFSTFRSEATLAFWYRLSAGQHQSTSNQRAGINIVSFPLNAAEVSRRSTNFQTCRLRHLRSCAFQTHRRAVMSLALGYQEGHLLGFYPIFRIEGAADHLDPEDWIPGPSLSKWRSSRGSDLQGFAKPFRKALSKTPQHHGSPPCLNFEGSPPWHGRCATRHPFVRNPDQCARPTRGFPSRCAPAHLLRSLSSNFSDRGCRRPPRSRGLDSGYLWKRNAAVQPTRSEERRVGK